MKSSRKPSGWTAGASVFSGRPDPVWELKPALGARLEKIWRALEPAEIEPPPSPTLGYRGCFLKGPRGREWFAFAGVVTLRSPRRLQSRSETRKDPAKKFERVLLASAPAGQLPPWLDA
jgi:hypothetical protein